MRGEDEADGELLRRYRDGDVEAFRRLYRRHAGRVLRLGRMSGMDQSEAEDLVQATFLRFHEARGRVALDRPLRPWLVTIALNLVRDRGRRSSRSIAAVGELAILAEARRAVRPDEEHEAARTAERLEQTLRELPDAQREAVLAIRVGGMSYTDAATALDRSEAAIRQNVHRGLRRLAEALREDRGADVTNTAQRRTAKES